MHQSPTSKSDSIRVLDELGADTKHRSTFTRCLQRINTDAYQETIAAKCFDHSVATTGISLILYDVTTLYFEAEKEDGLRKVGYSKERRVAPQIVVGLLVDRTGFPLEIGCFEGNKAETYTMIPIVKDFQDRHGVTDMVIVADAGMLCSLPRTSQNSMMLDCDSSWDRDKRGPRTIWPRSSPRTMRTLTMDSSSIR